MVIDLEDPSRWPGDVRAALAEHRDAILARGTATFSGPRYDAAIYALRDALSAHTLVGYHCTRLANHEVEAIRAEGMATLSPALVERRIAAAEGHGLLTADQAARLRARHSAGATNRAGMLWFVFFKPRLAGEGGIGDLVRYWGGEALYRHHDRDLELGPLIASIGRPAIVEAEMPVGWLGGDGGLRAAMSVAARYALAEGHEQDEDLDFEDNLKRPLPASFIRAIHLHPEPDFMRLSGMAGWTS